MWNHDFEYSGKNWPCAFSLKRYQRFLQVEKNKLGFGILEAILSEENLDFAYLVVIQEKDPIEFLAFIGFQRKRAINWN